MDYHLLGWQNIQFLCTQCQTLQFFRAYTAHGPVNQWIHTLPLKLSPHSQTAQMLWTSRSVPRSVKKCLKPVGMTQHVYMTAWQVRAKIYLQYWSKETQLWSKNFSCPPWRRGLNFEHSPTYSWQFQNCSPFLEEISAILPEKSWIEGRYIWKQKLHSPQNSIRNSAAGAPLANCMLKTQVKSNIAHEPSMDTITGTFCLT